ncbi:hypothetical protein I2F17_07310 [Acinetobacter sp. B10A]|uniref:hypothetical protein n=1 Tax=Acinetobacter baretiae TaxID=2605383 RepID=UPI001B3C7664|nr:hypothetical protein [Acinetobacter baretiae]MBF7685623.1 hypothetical protein [Acinetobacter baretiae]
MKMIIHNGYFLAKILLDSLDKKEYLVFEVDNKYEYKSKIYKHIFGFINLIIIIFYKKFSYLFNNKKKEEEVLLFSIDEIELLPKLLWKYRKAKNIHLWLWNPCNKILRNKYEMLLYITLLKQTGLLIWTFDKSDSETYNFNFHEQIYSNKLVTEYREEAKPNLYDLIFVGQDKGRLDELKKIMNILESYNLKYFFFIIPDKNKTYTTNDLKLMSTSSINYKDVLSLINNTKCILDIVQNGQYGATLRELEALFFNKKLLSNRESINISFAIENFIKLENIYKDSSKILEFLNSNMKENREVNNYDINHLINMIFKNTPNP